MTFKEFLANTLLPTFGEMGEEALEAVLEKLGYIDEEHFKTDLQGTYSLFKRVEAFAKTTKTKIDDTIAEAVLDAVRDVAKAHNYELPE